MPPSSPEAATPANTPPSDASTPTEAPPLKAILVIHGIGQQQPFQPLDSFVNGIAGTLRKAGNVISLTHVMHGRDEVFDHSFRVEAAEPGAAQPNVRLDVYEFYWAPYTQGRASFSEIAQWLLSTGFTPLRRLAFNIPLLIERAEGRASRETARGDLPGAGALWRRIRRLVAGRKGFWIVIELLREIWRLVYVALVAVALAGATLALVSQTGGLVKRVYAAVAPVLELPMLRAGAVWLALALVTGLAALALLLSIPEQIGDLFRLFRLEPQVPGGDGSGTPQALPASKFSPRKLETDSAPAVKWLNPLGIRDRWRVEMGARRWLLPLSVAGALGCWFLLAWLGGPAPRCLLSACPSPVVAQVLVHLSGKDLLVVLLLLGVAFLLKTIFVDYLGDIALYTTADQNSAYYPTRESIRTEATRRVRALLRNEEYAAVAVAGHSLGSVIGYDVISWLRVEAQLPAPSTATPLPHDLDTLLAGLPADKAEAARHLWGEWNAAIGAQVSRGPRSQGQLEAGRPIDTRALARLKTFITFGSPLNKVLYLFRARVGMHETVRAHIIQETHGYRQLADLLTRDASIRDQTDDPPDDLRWLNFYSPMDPVSARLVLYTRIDEFRRWYLVWGKCHMNYWHDRGMYQEILKAI